MSQLRVFAARIFRSTHARGAPLRQLCSTTSPPSPPADMDEVNVLFAEANLSLQDALESRGTVYFEDDFEDAKRATEETLRAFDALVAASSPAERTALLGANRPKMAQLRQQFDSLEQELIHDD